MARTGHERGVHSENAWKWGRRSSATDLEMEAPINSENVGRFSTPWSQVWLHF